MKKIIGIVVLLGIGLLSFYFLTENNTEFSSEQFAEVHPDSTYACLLTDEKLLSRMEEIQQKITNKATAVTELPNGYKLSFDNDPEMLKTLTHYIALEQACCPFFTFQLDIKANGKGIDMSIKGNRLVKLFVKSNLEGLGLQLS